MARVPEAHGAWAFGCDVCSEVCPWGSDAPDLSTRFGVHRALADAGLVSWMEVGSEPEDAFATRFEGSPLRRAKRAYTLPAVLTRPPGNRVVCRPSAACS